TALPFSWSGLHLHATGARALRVRITPRRTGEVALTAADTTGRPVLTLDSLTLREFDPGQIAAAGTARHLYRVVWKPLTAAVTTAVPVAWADLAPDAPAPDLLQLSLTPETTDLHHLLSRLQEFLTEPRYAAGHLLVTTRQAVAARPEDLVDPTAAAAWGLIRSAQNEQPDRITLLDVESATDPSDVPVGQPELVLREGTFHTPQLVRAAVDTTHQPTPFDPDATVLITGGTGTLGALIARHLITHHGVRHLLLTSRRGPDAPGATQLTTELTQLGATVRIVACDTTDRHTLTTLLREATPTIRAIIHTAGITDDATITTLTPQRLDNRPRPQSHAATTSTTSPSNSASTSPTSSSSPPSPPPRHPRPSHYAAANAYSTPSPTTATPPDSPPNPSPGDSGNKPAP
ncbi:Rossmann-fold NAD(P)(+)-binding protein, partial [Kitasatospora sp. Ki12]